MDRKKLSREELKAGIYGESGLYQRVVGKMEEIGRREAADILDVATQRIDFVKKAFHKDFENIKASTIFEYAEKLGVE